jgi:hypothetical protein
MGSPDNNGEVPTVIIACVTVIAVIAISGVVYLTAVGRPVDNVIVLIGALVTPTIASLMAVRQHRVNSEKLNDIKTKVDDKFDSLISDKAVLENQVAKLGAEPLTLPRGIPRINPTDTQPQERVRDNGR